MQNPYSRVPINGLIVDGELFDATTGQPWVVDEECNCTENNLCTAIACQEVSFMERDEAARDYRSTPPQPSREEWNAAYSDRPLKQASYDDLFGPEL